MRFFLLISRSFPLFLFDNSSVLDYEDYFDYFHCVDVVDVDVDVDGEDGRFRDYVRFMNDDFTRYSTLNDHLLKLLMT